MFTTRTRIVAAVIAVPALALTACSSDSGDSGSGSGSGSENVAAVIKGLDNPFFQAMEDGINAEAEADGVSVDVQAAQDITDTTGQAERLTALAQQDFGCFVVNPISGNNLVQGLASVDVPIVNIDQPLDTDAADAAGVSADTYIGTDNVSAGEVAGQQMVDLVGSGTVGLIGGIAGNITSEDRLTGFENAAGDSLDLLPVVSADWNRQQALTAATDLMTANPDLVGIFTANDDMALGAARAVADAGKSDDIAVIGLDGNEEALQAVADGTLAATVAQYPYAIGQLGMQACSALMAGDDVPESIEAPVALITPDNAEDALGAFPEPFEDFENPLD